jgi:hypothetical protein
MVRGVLRKHNIGLSGRGKGAKAFPSAIPILRGVKSGLYLKVSERLRKLAINSSNVSVNTAENGQVDIVFEYEQSPMSDALCSRPAISRQ